MQAYSPRKRSVTKFGGTSDFKAFCQPETAIVFIFKWALILAACCPNRDQVGFEQALDEVLLNINRGPGKSLGDGFFSVNDCTLRTTP